MSNLSIFKNRIFFVFPGPDHIKNFLTTKVDFLWKVPFFAIFSRFSRPNCVLNSFWSQNVLLFSLRVKKKFAKMYFRGSPKGAKKFLKFCKILDFLRFSQSKLHIKIFLTDFSKITKIWHFSKNFVKKWQIWKIFLNNINFL